MLAPDAVRPANWQTLARAHQLLLGYPVLIRAREREEYVLVARHVDLLERWHREHTGWPIYRQASAAQRILDEDLALARARARRRALEVVEADEEVRARRKAIEDRERALREAKADLARAEGDHETTRVKRDAAEAALAELRASSQAQEAETLGQLLSQAEWQATLAREMLERAEALAAERRAALGQLEASLAEREEDRRGRLGTIARLVDAIGTQAEDSLWPEGARMAEELSDGLSRIRGADEAETAPRLRGTARDLVAAAERREAELDAVEVGHAEHERRVSAEAEAARRHAAIEREVIAAEDRVARARAEQARRWDEVVERGRRVASSPPLVALGQDVLDQVLTAAESRQGERLRAATSEVDARGESRRAELADGQARLSRELGEVGRELGELDQHIERLRSAPEATPLRSPHREEARAVLRAAGLDCRPLYSLLDFAPATMGGERGQVERALLDAGLLDALVVRPEDSSAVAGLLRARGLADCWLEAVTAQPGAPKDRALETTTNVGLAGLADKLVVDPTIEDEDWREAGKRALATLADADLSPAEREREATLDADSGGAWRHGMLVGYASPGEPLGLVGASNRRARRERELADALASRDGLAVRLERLEADRAALGEAERQLGAALQALRIAADESGIAAAETALAERTTAAERVRDELARAAREAADLRERRVSFEQRLVARLAALGLGGPDRSLVRRVIRATRGVARSARDLEWHLDRLVELEAEDRAAGSRRQTVLEQVEASARDVSASRERLEGAEESAARWRERLASADVAEFRRRLEVAEGHARDLSAELLRLAERLGQARSAVASAERELVEAEEAARLAVDARGNALAALTDLLRLSPDLTEGVPVDAEDALLSLARSLMPSGQASRERLDRDAERAAERRRQAFDEERASLVEYDLFVAADERDRVLIRLSERSESTIAELLRHIQRRVRENELLLNAEEERLFKDYLCDTGLAAIHRAVQAAERLVQRINDLLDRTPLGHERYELKMDVRVDRHEEGSPLARHHALFRKDPATISADERQVLLEGIRAAVAEAHRRAEAGEGAFADLLTRAFDYREWFSLLLYVTDESGSRRRISSRTARTRSGAQQLFALYVPLFAALAALYGTASPSAPRLFAMDEAFDKVSEDNVTVLLRFLVDLGFQWIVASPRLSGAGRPELPACADWQLFHDQASALAQAIPIVYCDGQMLELAESSPS